MQDPEFRVPEDLDQIDRARWRDLQERRTEKFFDIVGLLANHYQGIVPEVLTPERMSALMEEAEWLTNNSEEGSVMEDAALAPGARTELQRAIAAYHELGERLWTSWMRRSSAERQRDIEVLVTHERLGIHLGRRRLGRA